MSGETVQTLEGHTDGVSCVAVLADGRVVSGSRDKTLRVWDLDSGECLHTLKGHTATVDCVAVLSNGRVVSIVFHEYSLRVWDPGSGECIAVMQLDAEVRTITTAPECVIIAGDLGGRVHFLRLEEPGKADAASPAG